jgi:glycine dehydrogenase subunit 2
VLLSDRPKSIGKVRGFVASFGVLVRAWAYIRSNGPDGLRRAAETAILNANYLKTLLADCLPCPYDHGPCMHEFVATAKPLGEHGVRAVDVAKALIDRGFHPPTMYFPLIVPEAIMIEPTETESKQTLDAFAAAIQEIVRLAAEDPDALRGAPAQTPVRRLDEVTAARKPILRWTPSSDP